MGTITMNSYKLIRIIPCTQRLLDVLNHSPPGKEIANALAN
jgi:hypothetical protein